MREGILTSGGDCQALNVTMRGLAKTLYRNVNDIEIIGFLQGYKGLMYEDYKIMKPKDFSGIINIGGTILGTSRCPFKKMRVIEDDFDKVAAMKNTYAKLKLDCLVVLGGNGSIKSANMLSQEGLNVIALPKTIDMIHGELIILLAISLQLILQPHTLIKFILPLPATTVFL